MQTIAFVARKGGVSKTTLAAHIAVAASASLPVTLVDTDPQESLKRWWEDRDADTPALMDIPIGKLEGELAKVKGQPGLVMIDTPAFDSGIVGIAIALADLVVIPVKPSPHDIRGVAVTVEAAKKAGKPFIFVVTQAVAGAALTGQVREALGNSGKVAETIMHHRVAYAGSMTDGRTVLETDPRSRAAQEVTAVQSELMTALQRSAKTAAGKGRHGK